MGMGIFTLLFCLGSHAGEKLAWNLNDVSILFALPTVAQKDTLLLKANDLIPEDAYSLNTHIVPEDYHPLDSFKDLRALGMRIDPCFKSTATQSHCEREIRIVWQPVVVEDSKITTRDAAIHTFYLLSDTQWSELLKSLQTLKKTFAINTQDLALGVHPTLANKHTQIPFQKALNELIHKYCGNQNITRYTFMRLQQKDLWWMFGGFDLVNGKWEKMKIPRVQSLVDDPVQNYFNEENMPTVQGMHASIVFSAKNSKETLDEVVHGYHRPDASDQKLFEEKLSLISRIENPRISNPNNMDCVHCHIAESVKHYMNIVDHLKKPKSFLKEMQLESRYNVENTSRNKENTRALRSFGYFGSDPHVNQRVINESVDVAEQLNLQ